MPIIELFDLSPLEQRQLRDERNQLRRRVYELEDQLRQKEDFIQTVQSYFRLLDAYGLEAIMPDPDNPALPLFMPVQQPTAPKHVKVRDLVLAIIERHMKEWNKSE